MSHLPKIIIGVRPSKRETSGDNSTEQHPRLQAAVLTLTKGPVCPSDKIGRANRDLIMRSAMADGTLLQPSRPATQLDMMFVDAVFGTTAVQQENVTNPNDGPPKYGSRIQVSLEIVTVLCSLQG